VSENQKQENQPESLKVGQKEKKKKDERGKFNDELKREEEAAPKYRIVLYCIGFGKTTGAFSNALFHACKNRYIHRDKLTQLGAGAMQRDEEVAQYEGFQTLDL
jgi:hypothetical protein